MGFPYNKKMCTHIQRHIQGDRDVAKPVLFLGISDWRNMNTADSDVIKFSQCQWSDISPMQADYPELLFFFLLPLERSGRYLADNSSPAHAQKLQPPPALKGHFDTLVQLGTFMAK